MIKIQKGNLFEAKQGLICHQVNCRGVMGAGVAKTFKEKYPDSFTAYTSWCKKFEPGILLGNCVFMEENGNITTCSMFAQDRYGRDEVFTDYEAFRRCCQRIVAFLKTSCNWADEARAYPINIPYKIGCGLAGGNWDIVYQILREELGNYNVILWKKEN